jgi:hypothetical protein
MVKRLYTITQEKMLKILSDGLPHQDRELHTCLYDGQGEVSNIQPHLTAIRTKIRRNGFDVMCVRQNGDTWYRMVPLMASAHDGRK